MSARCHDACVPPRHLGAPACAFALPTRQFSFAEIFPPPIAPPPARAKLAPKENARAPSMYGLVRCHDMELPINHIFTKFDERVDEETFLQSPVAISAQSPVAALHVCGDFVAATPMMAESPGADAGVVYSVFDQGECTCRVEVQASGSKIVSLSVVDPDYSVLVVAANLAPKCSLLSFSCPETYCEKLSSTLAELQRNAGDACDIAYLPTNEVVVSARLQHLPLDTRATQEQRRIWRQATTAIVDIGKLTRQCTEAHTRNELSRVRTHSGGRVREPEQSPGWRSLAR